MTDAEFDAALVTAAFALGADEGWRKVSAAAAAQKAGLDLAQARARFGRPGAILRKFGELADVHALAGAATEGGVRDRLFDILLRRFDFLQMHRPGMIALLRYLPLEPPVAAWLGKATLRSMGWMLEGAGVSAKGLHGELRKKGLLAVWAWGMRAWLRDETTDLATTMAAVDKALEKAEQFAQRFAGAAPAAAPAGDAGEPEPDEPFAVESDPGANGPGEETLI